MKKYDIQFFKQFAFSGNDALHMSQKGLEDYIQSVSDTKQIELLLLSMIHQSYELNSYIPNIELVLYKIFCSPIITKDERKEATDILQGNIFAAKNMSLPIDVYKSLL